VENFAANDILVCREILLQNFVATLPQIFPRHCRDLFLEIVATLVGPFAASFAASLPRIFLQ
jgi:hypothetical protein